MKKFFLAAAAAGALCFMAAPAAADGTLDGIIGGAYGAPVGTDLPADSSNGQAILDLTNLYVYDDGGTTVFIGMQMTGDIVATDWGKYVFYIETDTQTSGAGVGNGNGWGRPIQADGTAISPSYWLATWVDSGNGFELHQWSGTGSTWNMLYASYGTTGGIGFAKSTNAVEISVPRSALGGASTVKVVGMSTGGGGGDNAQDSVPSAGQAAGGDWGAMVTLTSATAAITVPVTVSGFAID